MSRRRQVRTKVRQRGRLLQVKWTGIRGDRQGTWNAGRNKKEKWRGEGRRKEKVAKKGEIRRRHAWVAKERAEPDLEVKKQQTKEKKEERTALEAMREEQQKQQQICKFGSNNSISSSNKKDNVDCCNNNGWQCSINNKHRLCWLYFKKRINLQKCKFIYKLMLNTLLSFGALHVHNNYNFPLD